MLWARPVDKTSPRTSGTSSAPAIIVVALVTPASATSTWVSMEIKFALSEILDRRGAEVIPVLAAPTELPPELNDRVPVDLTANSAAGLQQLVDQIKATVRADFSTLGPREFEALVADLLDTMGFVLSPGQEAGGDFVATYEATDPSGVLTTETWLVKAKLYRHQRFSVETIKKVVSRLRSEEMGAPLVTSARLTSVAQEYIAEIAQQRHIRVRVLDGTELKQRLRQSPEVVATSRATTTGGGHRVLQPILMPAWSWLPGSSQDGVVGRYWAGMPGSPGRAFVFPGRLIDSASGARC
ncbi:restriction endonuclease [Amycolatopsis magusensis]|uniref:restriction endonuclease n=1 Tax=Amycolatopsis magusensis TaxID=882444 RepID=UPI003C2D9F4D